MKFDLSILLLALYSTTHPAAAIPNQAASNEISNMEARGLGSLFTKIGAKLINKGDDIVKGSKNWQDKMQGGSKWPDVKNFIKDHSGGPGGINVNGKNP